MSSVILGFFALALFSYAHHCRWVTSEAYSSPSIVLISGRGANRYVLDDFREVGKAYEAVVMSYMALSSGHSGQVSFC